MDYTFLDENLVLERPEGVVRVLPDRVRVEDLAFDTLGGAIRASVNSLQGKKPRLSGSLDWTELDLKKIANAYHLKSPLPGRITGRADFSLKGDQVSGLDAQGHLAIEDSQLFDVPILGPLSPVVATVLGNRKAGFQEASSAFFTFNVEEGVLHSHDFLTTTPSLVFTADGSADLNDQTLDMTVRMNARGLLGVITLPLKPFYGLFQFRGTGPLQNPEWDNVMFTSPPDEEQNQRLMEPPRALPVLEGAPRPHRETLSPRKKR
nr:AsmA-like C-terminal region-containing protein [Haloferula luteola]